MSPQGSKPKLATPEDWKFTSTAEIQWREVIEQRSKEIENGSVKCLPTSQVIRRIRKLLKKRSKHL